MHQHLPAHAVEATAPSLHRRRPRPTHHSHRHTTRLQNSGLTEAQKRLGALHSCQCVGLGWWLGLGCTVRCSTHAHPAPTHAHCALLGWRWSAAADGLSLLSCWPGQARAPRGGRTGPGSRIPVKRMRWIGFLWGPKCVQLPWPIAGGSSRPPLPLPLLAWSHEHAALLPPPHRDSRPLQRLALLALALDFQAGQTLGLGRWRCLLRCGLRATRRHQGAGSGTPPTCAPTCAPLNTAPR
jgi:hypothetical protein